MLIQRFDNLNGSEQARSVGPAGSGAGPHLNGSGLRNHEAEGVVGGDELDLLMRRLDAMSDIRPEVVAAAQVRLHRGDYLTHAAAEQTAAAILGTDA